MSTVPTVPTAEAVPVLFSPEATQAAGGFDSIKQMMDNFDPAALLPELDSLSGWVVTIARLAVMAGPLVLLGLGIAYLLFAPKEANYTFGYRCYYGMGSPEAWRYTQRMAGLIWSLLGLVLTAVMLVSSIGYGGMPVMEVIDAAVTGLIWELVLTILSCLAINGLVMYHFNRSGGRRYRN